MIVLVKKSKLFYLLFHAFQIHFYLQQPHTAIKSKYEFCLGVYDTPEYQLFIIIKMTHRYL